MAHGQPYGVMPRHIGILGAEGVRRKMRPHVKPRRHDDKGRHSPDDIQIACASGKHHKPRLHRFDLGKHFADAAAVMVRQIQAEEQHGAHHHDVLDDSRRRDAFQAAQKYKQSDHDEGDDHGVYPRNRAQGRDLYDKAQRRQLQLQIRKQKGDADAGY